MSDERAARLERALRLRWDDLLGEHAVREALIDETKLQEAVEQRDRAPHGLLSSILVERGWLSREEVDDILSSLKAREFSRPSPDNPVPPEVLEAAEDPSRTLSEFVLVVRVGSGGAAEVWKSWDRLLGRWVAVKVPRFPPESRTAAERFRREALAAARLTHPNIIPIYRVAEDRGRPYLVMQYIEGKTLLEERPPLERVPALMRDVALAVEYAHSRGVIHRDVKPGNLLLDREGCPWIFDFGLVFLPDEHLKLTLPGTLVGTPSYMSPEQAAGADRAHEAATDVYSLGATLYDLATGRAPFEGTSVADVVTKVREADPRLPRSVRPDLPQGLERIILKAMDKDPARRYGTAQELAEDLDRFVKDEPVRASKVSPFARAFRRASRHRAPIGAVALGLTLAAGLGLWAGRASPAPQSPASGPAIAPSVSERAAIELRPDDAVLHGETLMRYHAGERRTIDGWNSTECYAEWAVDVPEAGRYKAELTYAAGVNNGGICALVTETERWTGKLSSTGGWHQFQTIRLGTISLSKKTTRISFRVVEVSGGLCSFRRLHLVPEP